MLLVIQIPICKQQEESFMESYVGEGTLAYSVCICVEAGGRGKKNQLKKEQNVDLIAKIAKMSNSEKPAGCFYCRLMRTPVDSFPSSSSAHHQTQL